MLSRFMLERQKSANGSSRSLFAEPANSANYRSDLSDWLGKSQITIN